MSPRLLLSLRARGRRRTAKTGFPHFTETQLREAAQRSYDAE